jgi:succinate-semialdehyde dehydrogenase/glutarate-semialdehyde dehydrogenase
MSLELGGHAPVVIFDDADIDLAVRTAMDAKFRASGQSCIAGNRIYVQKGVYDEFVARFTAAAGCLKVGSGLDDETDVGPMINESAVQRLRRQVDDAVKRGARVDCGHPKGLDGLFVAPAVLTNVASDAAISTEETFGPLAPIYPFETDDEAIAAAQHPEYGLAAYIASRSHSRIWRVAEALEFGMIGVNTGLISNESVPFGGIKQSGLGREGSRQGIREFLEEKYICIAD